MQKLVWKNSLGDEIDLTSGNYAITEWEGFSNLPLNVQSQQVPFEDGGVYLDSLLEQRDLAVTLAMNDGGNLEARYRMRRELIHALNPKLGEGYLIYTNNFTSKRIKCVAQVPLFETHNSNDSGTPKASLAWIACDPYWEDLEETSVFLKSGVRTKLHNNGDVPVGVSVDFFTNNVTNPQIKNFTEKKLIKLNGTFQNEININTNLGQKNITTENMGLGISQVGTYLRVVKYVKELDTIIVVGNKKTIITSKDGVYWKGPESIDEGWNDRDLFDVVYVSDLGLFVVVGGDVIITSADGKNWSVLDINEILLSVTYGDGVIVATGSYGKIYTSTDGINWILRPSGINNNLKKVIYQEKLELFVAVGSEGIIITSPDGINWTQRTSGTDKYLNSVVYADAFGKFYAVGDGVILTSPDGINWTDTESGITHSLVSITYSKVTETLVILEHQKGLYISTNGETWTRETATNNYRDLNDVTYIDNFGVFMLVGENGLIFTSGDCIEWEGSALEGEVYAWGSIYGIVYSERLKMYVGCIRSGAIATSADGMKWNVKGLGTRVFLGITYSESLGVFVIVGYEYNSGTSLDDGIIYTSNDAVHWTRQADTAEKVLNSVIYAEDFGFVAVGDGVILTSPDGTTWTQRSSVDYNFMAVVYSKDLNLFLATYGTTMFKSTDGINWEDAEAVGVNGFTHMIYVDTLKEFVAVGYYGVYTSTDGIVWSSQNADTHYSLYSVAYSEELGMFIAVGMNGTMFISLDAINWESEKSGTNLDLNAIVSNKGVFVCGGNDGVVLKSEFTLAESLIANVSEDSNMSLGLQSGQNEILLSKDSGNLSGRISYRQKYIGV